MNYFTAIQLQRDDFLTTYNDLKQIFLKKFAYMTIDKYSSYITQLSQNMIVAKNNVSRESSSILMICQNMMAVLLVSFNLKI